MHRGSITVLVLVLVLGLVAPVTAQEADGRYRGFGDPGGFWNIVPPGQDGVANAEEALTAQLGEPPEHFDDQLGMYDRLVYEDATPGFSAEDLPRHFKDGSFGVPPDDIGRVYSPGDRDDVTVIRDESFGVPHIFGETREGTMFAAGYTGAEDRLFLMDVLRHVGRAELSAFLGPSPGNLAMDRSQLAVAPYVEEDLTRQVEEGREEQPQVFEDATAFVSGINRYIGEALVDPRKMPAEYPALQQVPEEFVLEDIVAIASLVGGIFGKGGGREVANLCGLNRLGQELGEGEARRVFDDLKFPDDAEAPVHTERSFPYMGDLGPVDPGAVPDIDCSSLRPIEAPPPGPEHLGEAVVELVPVPPEPAPPSSSSRTGTIDLPWGSVPIQLGMGMSNAVLVGAEHTDTGTPLAVFGPQTGYFVPQLLVEKDIHGPGISARGVSFAGTDLYVQLGRGRDYAFSATSAGADNVDQFVLRLCDPDGGEPTTDSMGYLHDGTCEQIEGHQTVRIAKPSAGGIPEDQESFENIVLNRYFERAPHYGPVTARGTLADGTPIAVATARTTYLDELGSARGFRQINDPDFMAGGVESFQRAFRDGVDYTFNWFYVDDEHIAFQVSCWCPQRAAGVDPYLPAWGTGEWDWRGDLPRQRLPFAVDPEDGRLVSWNNKQAPRFLSNDAQFGWGPIHRADLLQRRLDAVMADGPVDVGSAVDVMALAATTDLRAQELVPLLGELLGEAPDDADPRAQQMLDLVRAWADDDLGHRRDHDADGAYEHAQAVAIMDAWWEPLVDAMFEDASADARRELGISLHDPPQEHLGSAFQDSMYAHVHKDLRQVLGRDVTDPLHRTYCGGGDPDRCREDVWGSLSQAASLLEEEFGSSDVEDWRREPADDEIRHQAVGVVSVPPIHWQNRPTFQQVVQLPAADRPQAAPPTRRPLPATGGGQAALGALIALVLALLGSRSLRRGA